jgi:hypothetical protein
MATIKEIKIPIFDFTIFFITAKDYGEYRRTLKKHFKINVEPAFYRVGEFMDADSSRKCRDGTYIHKQEGFIYYKKDSGIPIIIHELNHAVEWVCKRTGVNDEESRCYLLEYLAKQIIRR